MPYRKKARPYWHVWLTLPGFGRVGPWSTGTRQKALARSMEDYLREAVLRDPRLVRGVVEGRYSLRDLWVAKLEGRTADLLRLATDPPLPEVIRRFETTVSDRRTLHGIAQLREAAPEGARLSWLARARCITDLCADAIAAGRKPNSVRRSLYRAIVDLLAYELGKVRRAEILMDVVKPGEDDSRDVTLRPEEIRRLLDACDVQFRPLVTLAILTGVDRGPLLRLRPADFNADACTLRVRDTKTRSRPRTLEVSDATAAILRRICAGRAPGDRLFPWSKTAVHARWHAARADAGVPHVRFKDLRHVFATLWVEAGGSLKDLGGVLGHTQGSTTLRYTARQPHRRRAQMELVAASLDLETPHLKLETAG